MLRSIAILRCNYKLHHFISRELYEYQLLQALAKGLRILPPYCVKNDAGGYPRGVRTRRAAAAAGGIVTEWPRPAGAWGAQRLEPNPAQAPDAPTTSQNKRQVFGLEGRPVSQTTISFQFLACKARPAAVLILPRSATERSSEMTLFVFAGSSMRVEGKSALRK